MSNSNNDFRFRSSLMGFNRDDVLTYLEQRAKDHVEERNELARKLESSHHELSELRDKLSQTDNDLQNMKSESDAQATELEELRGELDKLRSSNSELTERCTASDQELKDLRSERDMLALVLEDLNAQNDEIEATKVHVAEIELEAYTRAKKIETGAIENANLARRTLADLIAEAKRSFDRVKDNANNTLFHMAQEMDSLKDTLMQIPEGFDVISNDMESLRFGNDKKPTVSEIESESPEADEDSTILDSSQLTEDESSTLIDVDEEMDTAPEGNSNRDRPVLEDLLFFRGEETKDGQAYPDLEAKDSGSTGDINKESVKSNQGYTYSFHTEESDTPEA